MKARLPQGYGKQSQQQLMQQVQQMQENMRLKQEELENTEYSVTSGGGMVELKMTGKHQVTGLKINPDVVEKDDVEMLEDLIGQLATCTNKEFFQMKRECLFDLEKEETTISEEVES